MGVPRRKGPGQMQVYFQKAGVSVGSQGAASQLAKWRFSALAGMGYRCEYHVQENMDIRGTKLEASDRDGGDRNNVPDHLELPESSVDQMGDEQWQGNHDRH